MAITPATLINEFRLHTEEPESVDELWSDTEVLAYLNEARDEFAARTHIIVDSSTAALTQYSVTAGQEFVPYDNDVIVKFKDNTVDTTNNRRLHTMTMSQLDEEYAIPSYHKFDYNQLNINPSRSSFVWQTQTGQTRYLITDMELGSLRLYPIPTADFNFTCTVCRLPQTDITDPASTTESDFEIPRKYRRMLLDYMEYKAYTKEDAETYDVNIAERALAEWERNIQRVKIMIENEKGAQPRVVKYRDF